MKKLKYIFILLLCCFSSGNVKGRNGVVGGWVEVTPIGNGKYQVDIQLLIATTAAYLTMGSTHIDRINMDTSVRFKVIDSSGNSVTIPAKFMYGYLFSQKDTSNKWLNNRRVLVHNYYKNQFRCTLDLNNPIIKSSINTNSSFLDFHCDFTGRSFEEYRMIKNTAMEYDMQSPIARTRLYLKELTTNEKSLVFANCAMSKFADYDSANFPASNYYNPGVYGKYGDSLFMELVQPENSYIVNSYKTGYSATVPAYSFCPDKSNNCAANPNTTPAQGFYFNSQTGDMVFTSAKPWQYVRFDIKAHHYRKNSSGQWRYLGFSILHQGMITAPNYMYRNDSFEYAIFPLFVLPKKILLCEGDSVITNIKTTVPKIRETYTASLAGNFPNASVTTNYSTGNSTPTFRLKVVAKKGDNSSAPGIVTLRVHADSNWTRGEAARSVPVYVYKPINPEIEVSTNGCNNLKAVFKGANTDVPVKLTWSLHEKSPSSPAIFTSTNDSFTYDGLLPEKYFVKCYVIPQLASCKCSGKTVMDSLDMKKLWPGLDFQLNRNSVCLADSTKVYFPKNMQKFKSNITYAWEVNGKKVEPNRPDTLAVRLSAGSTIKLTLTDDSGCVMSKSFILPVDTIYFLQQESFLERCNPDTLSLGALSPYSNSFVQGGYTVINDANEVEFLAEEQIFKYFYNRPKYQVLSTFTSQDGCVINFTTDILIDTTQIRIKPLPSLICKGMKTLSLGSLRATPAGGVWSSSQGKDTLISLNIPGKYPHYIFIQYQIESSGCVKTLSDTFQVIDTLKNTLTSVGPVCKETKVWEAPKEFKFSAGGSGGSSGSGGSGGSGGGSSGNGDTSSGTWYSPVAGLNISSNGLVYPKKSAAGIYPVYRYSLSTEGCSVQHEGKVEILPPVLNISANISTLMGKPPLVVNFEGLNNTLVTTRYTWLFGDKNKAPNDTATGKNVSYTYFDTGKYTPRLIGTVGACRDTLVLTTINVGLMSVESLTQSLRVHIFPNPTELGSGCTVWVEGQAKNRSIAIYNALGKCIYVHRLSADQDRLELTAPAAGLYFVEVEGIDKPLKWLVE